MSSKADAAYSKLRMKLSYWAKRVEEGRDDSDTLEKYARYWHEMEAVKEERQKKRDAQKAAEAAKRKEEAAKRVSFVVSFE